jgi:uncharacterized membrane protein YedE/YeeE
MKPIVARLVPLACGLIFGAGLVVSGMVDTDNVKGFLDIAGIWKPDLALVMGGAILAGLPLFQWTQRRGKALDGNAVETPPKVVDLRLIAGAAIFGVGWGLSGICPGPALVWLGVSPLTIAPFLLAVAAGAFLADRCR